MAMNEDSQPRSLLGKIGSALFYAAYWSEHVVVLAIETARRLAHRLDARLYAANRRVKGVRECVGLKASDKFVVFVLYCDRALPSFTKSAIECFGNSEFNLVVVANSALNPSALQYIESRCQLLIERANIGRDFGGYKDGIDEVFRRYRRF